MRIARLPGPIGGRCHRRYGWLPIVVACALAGCDRPADPASNPAKGFRVAVGRFEHETCTFCPGGDLEIADWTRIRPPFGGDTLLNEGGSYVDGFVAMAREFGDITLIGLTSPDEAFGGYDIFKEAAIRRFNACHRLQPDNWTYKRQAWSLVGNERVGGEMGRLSQVPLPGTPISEGLEGRLTLARVLDRPSAAGQP